MRIEASGLGAALKGRAVLHDLDFSAEPGELTAIVGPNGAGKTTLLRTLAGLLPATGGTLMLAGRRLGDWAPRMRARMLAYLPQERIVHWALSARAVVALGRLPHQAIGAGESPNDARAIAAALAAMDVDHLAARPVVDMSGGERARVLIARALAQEAQALLADEPAAGLDPAHQLTLFAHFARLAAEGRTVIVALHDLSLAARFCHRIVLLADGRCIAAGAAQDVLSVEHLATVYGISGRYMLIDGLPVVLARDVLP
jgi:iron complex transport system ATP-binding protein